MHFVEGGHAIGKGAETDTVLLQNGLGGEQCHLLGHRLSKARQLPLATQGTQMPSHRSRHPGQDEAQHSRKHSLHGWCRAESRRRRQ